MLNTMFEQIWAKKFLFLGTFFFVFTLSYMILVAIDFLPEEPVSDTSEIRSGSDDTGSNEEESVEENVQSETSVIDTAPEIVNSSSEVNIKHVESDNVPDVSVPSNAVLPVSVHIEKLGKTVSVLNPSSRTIADLDAALLDGVVRHPDSATLSQEGNVFILGHSSYLPQVFNKNFQAFNGIQNLAWGDSIEVFSAEKVYEYRVEKVYRAQAKDVTVPIAGTGNMLTLATCNSFGSTDDRYIVEAKQISVRSI